MATDLSGKAETPSGGLAGWYPVTDEATKLESENEQGAGYRKDSSPAGFLGK